MVTGAVLAVGARQMAKEKAIVSRLSALEELSGMEVLCSDKTGTLTLNRLTLDKAGAHRPWGPVSSAWHAFMRMLPPEGGQAAVCEDPLLGHRVG